MQKNVSVYIGDKKSPIARASEVLARANGTTESDLFKLAFKEYCEKVGLFDFDKKVWKAKKLLALETKFPPSKKGRLRKELLNA